MRFWRGPDAGPDALKADGPLVVVDVGAPSNVAQYLGDEQMAMPNLRSARMLVDTGARFSAVRVDLPPTLGLPALRFQPVTGISGREEEYPVYRLAFSLPMVDRDGGLARPLDWRTDVVAMPWASEQIDGILGRDFLAQCHLAYDGRTGEVTLSAHDV